MKSKKSINNYAIFIITHKRPNNQITLKALKRANYTGKTYLIVDDKDPTLPEYKEKYGKQVIVFSKEDYYGKFDLMTNEKIMGIATYARNALYDMAKKKGLDYIVVMDDDYSGFYIKIDKDFNYANSAVTNMDKVIAAYLKYLKNADLDAIAFAQGGDFLGGENGGMNKRKLPVLRKIMNVFFFDVDKPVYYYGAMNDDVIAGITLARQGRLAMTPTIIATIPAPTQSVAGGLTELYKDSGTYQKSMYAVVASPSSVTTKYIDGVGRVHHWIDGTKTYPCIVSGKWKKK